MTDKDKNKDLLNEFLIDEDSDTVEKRISKNSSTNNSSDKDPWKVNSQNDESKKSHSNNKDVDLNKNSNEKDEIKSAVPKSNTSQKKERKKVSNAKPLLVIFSLAALFIGIVAFNHYKLNPNSKNLSKNEKNLKLIDMEYSKNVKTWDSIFDDHYRVGDDYIFTVKNYSNYIIKEIKVKFTNTKCGSWDKFLTDKGDIRKFNLTINENQSMELIAKNVRGQNEGGCFAMIDLKGIK